jgi:hypothetical protein
MDERELWQTWDTFGTRLTWLNVLRQADTQASQRVAEQTLAQLPAVTSLHALAANAQLVELLTGRRWYVIQAAREVGAGWEEIGAVLGMTKQDIRRWYTDAIVNREHYVPEVQFDGSARFYRPQ